MALFFCALFREAVPEKEEITVIDEQLLHHLKANCAGKKNMQTRAQLQRKLKVSKDQLTNAVHRMRCKGIPIAGGPGGYYYALNAGEIHATIRWLEKMVRTLLKSIEGLVKALDYFGLSESSGVPGEALNGGGSGGEYVGAPAEAQRSGFGGERRSDEAGELFADRRKRASEVRDNNG